MPPIVATLLWTLAAFSVFGVIILWAKAYARDLRASSKALDEFYSAAQSLIKDEATPAGVVQFVELFASRVGEPGLVRQFALHSILGGLNQASAPRNEAARKFAADLNGLSANQRELFGRLVLSGMVSCAAADPFLSPVYKALILMFLSKSGRKGDEISPDRVATVAVDVADLDHCAFA